MVHDSFHILRPTRPRALTEILHQKPYLGKADFRSIHGCYFALVGLAQLAQPLLVSPLAAPMEEDAEQRQEEQRRADIERLPERLFLFGANGV